LYGAFPTDPYSHTPFGKGAQQPGMTGQVKEDILSRFGELGVFVNNGKLFFNPLLLKRNEFINKARKVEYVNTSGEKETVAIDNNTLFFTYCQVPLIYLLAEKKGIEIVREDGTITKAESTMLSENDSEAIFQRSGEVKMVKVFVRV
jgi:hypothetical protein